MAKKSTHLKRASKVRKEEHLVLGGDTKNKKFGVKKETRSEDGRPPRGRSGTVKGRGRPDEQRARRPRPEGAARGVDERQDRPASFSNDKPRFDRDGSREGRPPRSTGGRSDKPRFERDDRSGERGARPPRGGSKGNYTPRENRGTSEDRPKRFEKSKSYGDRPARPSSSERGGRSFEKKEFGSTDKRFDKRKEFGSRDERAPREEGAERRFEKKDFGDKPKRFGKDSPRSFDKPKFERDGAKSYGDKPRFERPHRENNRISGKSSHSKFTTDRPFKGFERKQPADDGTVRLNKYLSQAGICSRREADKYIEDGLITVNGVVVTTLGTKVKPTDVVQYAGEKVRTEQLRYILLNKPKDVITTLSDEKGRSTVMGLIRGACKERVYPVGRLDRNTTGLILLTNDGDLAKKLSHPSHEVRKVYHVITDKNITQADLKKLESGIQLEDGLAKADAALFAGDGSVKNEVGLEIHSGKNRIVRRMFEALGYDVVRLDRAAFAGLSKKGLPRGRWRFLTETEVGYLKMI